MGLRNPNEKTVQTMVGVFLALTNDTNMSDGKKLEIVRELKSFVKVSASQLRLNIPWLARYPEHPRDLPAGMYAQIYHGENGEPTTIVADLSHLERVIRSVPLRTTDWWSQPTIQASCNL
jgi:hypothetical protein